MQPWKFHASRCFASIDSFVTRFRSLRFLYFVHGKVKERRFSIDPGEVRKVNRPTLSLAIFSSASFRVQKSSYFYDESNLVLDNRSIDISWLKFYLEISKIRFFFFFFRMTLKNKGSNWSSLVRTIEENEKIKYVSGFWYSRIRLRPGSRRVDTMQARSSDVTYA